MQNIQDLKGHLTNIFDAIELGKFKKNSYNLSVDDKTSEHWHQLNYISVKDGLYVQYGYYVRPHDRSTRGNYITVESTNEISEESRSYMYVRDEGGIDLKVNPKTMDDMYVAFESDKEKIKLPYQEMITEESYFMFSTLYNIPQYELFHELLCMLFECRAHIHKYKYILGIRVLPNVAELYTEDLIYEVKY